MKIYKLSYTLDERRHTITIQEMVIVKTNNKTFEVQSIGDRDSDKMTIKKAIVGKAIYNSNFNILDDSIYLRGWAVEENLTYTGGELLKLARERWDDICAKHERIAKLISENPTIIIIRR